MAVLAAILLAVLGSGTTVARAADPAPAMLTGVAADGPARRGMRATFRVTARNAGDAATTVPLVVRLAPGNGAAHLDPRAAGSGWTCAPDGQALRCQNDDPVAAGASAALLTYTAATPATAPASSVFALVASSSGPPAGAVGQSAATVAVVDASPADVVLSVTSPGPARSDAARPFDVRVRNAGAAATAEPVAVTFPVDDGSIAASGVGWSCDPVTRRCVYALPLLGGAEATPLRATVAPGSQPYDANAFAAAVSGGDDRDLSRNNDVASALGTLVPPSDVDLTVATAGTGAAPVAGRAGFVVRVGNAGSASSAGLVTVRLTRNSGDASATATAAGDGWTCPSGTAMCTTSVPVPAGGRAAPLLVEAPADEVGGTTASVVATVSGAADAVVTNDVAGASRSVLPTAGDAVDVALTDVLPRRRGTTSTASVSVSGPGAGAADGPLVVRITSALPAVASGRGWVCTAELTCRREPDPAAGEAAPPIALELGVDAAAPRQSYAIRVAATAGPDAPTRVVTATTSVGAPLTDVALSVPELHPLVRGEQAAFPLRVSNSGADPAPGPVTVALDAFAPGPDADGAGWACTTRSIRGLRCVHDGPVPARGALPDLTLREAARPLGLPGVVRVTGSVRLPVGADVDPSNNRVSATTTVGVNGVELTPTFRRVSPARDSTPGTAEIVVHNTGSRPSAGDVVLARTGWTGIDGDGWRCVFACRYTGTILPGATSPPLRIQVGAGGDLEVALSGGGDLDASDARAATRVPVAPPRPAPYLELSAFAPGARPGATTTFTASLTARGGTVVPEAVDVRLDPSPGVVVLDVAGAGMRCAGLRCRLDAGIPEGATRVVRATLRLTSRAGGPAAVRIRTGTTVPGPGGDDEALARVVPLGSAGDLVATVDGPGTQVAGDRGAFRVDVHNTGEAAVRGPVRVDVSHTAPFGTTDVASRDGWTCESDGRTCLHDGPVAAGGTLPTLAVRVPVPRAFDSGDRATIGATVSALSDDDTGGDNGAASASAPVSNADVPNLGVSLAATGPLAFRGPARFEARVRNTGPRRTTAPVELGFAGRLGPTGVLTPSGPGWACPEDDASCVYRGALDPGEQAPPLTLSGTDGTFGFGAPETADVLLRSPAGTASDDAAHAEAPRPPAPDAAGPDATVDLTGGEPVSDGEQTTVRATVRGAGTTAASGGTSLRLVAAGGRATATGAGWTCTAELTCTTETAVRPGEGLPPVDVVLRRDRTDAARSVRVAATVAVVGDVRTADDTAIATVGVGEGRTDLTVEATRTAALRAGTTAVSILRVRNAGTRPTTAPTTVVADASVSPSLAGDGWECDGSRCTYAASIAAGAAAPDVRATQAFPADSDLGLDPFSATISGGGDAEVGNDVATATAGIGVGARPAPGRSTRLGIDPLVPEARPGDVVAVQLAVRAGSDDVAGPATAVVDLPSDVEYVPTDPVGPAPTVTGRRLSWSLDVPQDRRPSALRFAVAVAPGAAPGVRELDATLRRDGAPDETDASTFLVLPSAPPASDPGSAPGAGAGAGA
ncbi:hypothetical protein, partial [Patulibacter sp.]|uniref:hypothetical protein n=1 Tax=Patulibacter sp. TaxID=1912859 RepID=UPI00351F3891